MERTLITRINEKDFSENPGYQKAREKMKFCITGLKQSVREMIFALSVFEPVAIYEVFPLMTNGRELYYSPEYVLNTGCAELKKEIMHITMHGLLGHFEEEKKLSDRDLSWAVMDLKAERMMRFLLQEGNLASREPLGLELYYRSVKNAGLRAKVLSDGERVKRDDHNAWRMKSLQFTFESESGYDASDAEIWKEAVQKTKELLQAKMGAASGDTLEKCLESMMEKAGKTSDYGMEAGEIQLQVGEDGKPALDYRNLLGMLEKHAIGCGEEDVPDPVFYSYGMELYEDMPLVEPLEETERPRLDTVVVATDTSGSCLEGLPVFLRESGELFRQLAEEVELNRLWYLECDAQIRMEEIYEGEDIADAFQRERRYCGGGGTDFCPVFEKIAKYQAQGGEVDCLIFYTDGMGRFPKVCPEYPCYFIMPDKDCENKQLPDWVIPVELRI